jgi:Na+-transporting NADH:ubiquinone oxidoreductase subunit C
MAINKESNAYTVGFAVVLVVVVGSILASLSLGLKDKQNANGIVKKKMDILAAMGVKSDRKTAEGLYNQLVVEEESVVLNSKGEVVDGSEAFNIDIRKEYKDKTLTEDKKNYPVFVAKKDGKTIYILPVVGKGLWGPIWGYVSIGEDMKTIDGASFGHQGETPGLGAEISQPFFINRWIKETISNDVGDFEPFEIVKDGSGANPKKVDGITGGTITSKGVEEMMNRCMAVYANYFKTKKS